LRLDVQMAPDDPESARPVTSTLQPSNGLSCRVSPTARARASREAEILVLRQQLLLNRKSRKRIRLRNIDRLILVCLYGIFPPVLDVVIIVKPETVLRWHRRGFRAYWRWKSWRRGAGRSANHFDGADGP
jgi:hypothetical protein